MGMRDRLGDKAFDVVDHTVVLSKLTLLDLDFSGLV